MSVTKRTAAAAIVAALMLSLSGPVARADHGADASGWIEQGGNGAGASTPMKDNFVAQTVLFDQNRFALPATGTPRPGATRYMAWGTFINDLGDRQLGNARSDNGYGFDDPRPAYIRQPDGSVVPFLLNGDFADVVFVGSSSDRLFAIYWFAGPVYHDAIGGVTPWDITAIHRAISADGVLFEAETPMQQSAVGSVTAGPNTASWKAGTIGPGDVIYQPSASNASACASSNPWNCRYVMTYGATGDPAISPVVATGLAGSPDGLTWTGMANPILCTSTPMPGTVCGADQTASWDTNTASLGRIRKITPSRWEMYYVGGSFDLNECGAFGPCWRIGVATSTDGLVWRKANVAEPAIRPELMQAFSPGSRVNMLYPNVVDDQTVSGSKHARIYFSRLAYDGAYPSPTLTRDVFIAATTPAPGSAPTIRIGQPDNGWRPRAETPIDIFVNDSIGSPAGIDLSSAVLTLDGTPLDGWTWERSIVTATREPGYRITSRGELHRLADGPHTFAISVADVEGNRTSTSTRFIIDTTAPLTTLSGPPPSTPQIGFPDSIGTFRGRTVEAATHLTRVRATVTNPLGQQKYFDSTSPYGWIISKTSPADWSWTWIAPSMDPFFAIPGSYTVTISGQDIAGNLERASASNTVTVLAL